MQDLTFIAFRKDNIYFRTIEEREKISTNNWSAKIKYIMIKIGTTSLRGFEQLEVCDTKNVNKFLHDMHTNDWFQKIVSVPKLRTYRTYKTTYNVENTF